MQANLRGRLATLRINFRHGQRCKCLVVCGLVLNHMYVLYQPDCIASQNTDTLSVSKDQDCLHDAFSICLVIACIDVHVREKKFVCN